MTLSRIFEPRSIAVVGASANPTKRGHQILRALTGSRFAGTVYAVNRGGGSILGHPVYRSIEELPEAADLAVLCTPAAAAPALVRACGERGVAGAVVLAVGFGESGEQGAELEEQLRQAGHRHGVRIIGPNTSGLLNLPLSVNLIGARGVRPGGIALLVQSGNIALVLMTEVTERSRMGISICCGLGNEVDVGFGEVLEYLGGHDETRAVIAHIEGCRDARAFLRAASGVTRKKPVVVIKSGRTGVGANAALSHTGAVAGPYDRLRAGFAQAGVVEVRRTDELLHVAEALASQPPGPAGTGVTILSDGGGQSTLVVDALQEMGIPLAELSLGTSVRLRKLLGPAAAVRTPVDVTGAVAAAVEAGCPVAIKLLAKHITHKSDAGGVLLDVRTGDEARAAFTSIAENAYAYARTHGLPEEDYEATVAPMLATPVAELLAGAYRDPQLGPVLTAGAGGTWIEVLRDVAHRVLPMDEDEVATAIGELKVSALLAAARGGRAARVGPIVDAAKAVAECAVRWPDVAEVEINPLFAYPDRVIPVDAQVVLAAPLQPNRR